MQVFTLNEGSYSVAADKKFIPFVPGKDQAKDRPGSLFINVQPFLVQFDDKLLLLDTGLGYSNSNGDLILHENIRKAGFDPSNVDYVLMSHLHFDHAGGMVHKENNGMELSFPNAEYVIQREKWEGAFTNPSSSYRTEIFDFLQRNAQLTFVDETGEFLPGIRHELTGAHTPFHHVWLLDDGKDKSVFGGDVLPEPEELLRKFIAKYDYDGRKAMEMREEFGKPRCGKKTGIAWFYHGKSRSQGFIGLTAEGNLRLYRFDILTFK